MKNTQSADFRAERIDGITNFAVITNVVIKRFTVYESLAQFILSFQADALCRTDGSTGTRVSNYTEKHPP